MQIHTVKVHPSKTHLQREEQLAWKIAAVAADVLPVQPDVTELIINRIIDRHPDEMFLIEGHTDERGSSEYNLALGDKRARAAEEFLTTMGIPDAQLSVISYGKDHPICTDQTEACWQKNRRAHITASR